MWNAFKSAQLHARLYNEAKANKLLDSYKFFSKNINLFHKSSDNDDFFNESHVSLSILSLMNTHKTNLN